MAEVTDADIQRLARLSRLEVTPDEAPALRKELGKVLGWMDRLGELDLEGVVPMTRASSADEGEEDGTLAPDEPGSVLGNEVVMGLAPEPMPPFFRVPRVLGEGGGA